MSRVLFEPSIALFTSIQTRSHGIHKGPLEMNRVLFLFLLFILYVSCFVHHH